MTMPIGLVLLFLMGVAPVLPWRKASGELLRERLFVPAWCGVGTLALSVLLGADSWASLLAFALAGFAAGSAMRQLVLATRRQGVRGLLGRANGGMVVHLGVILIAVGLVASNGYTTVGEFTLKQGTPLSFGGHTFQLVEVTFPKLGSRGKRDVLVAITLCILDHASKRASLLVSAPVPTPAVTAIRAASADIDRVYSNIADEARRYMLEAPSIVGLTAEARAQMPKPVAMAPVDKLTLAFSMIDKGR
jgi:hypothetical protein